jgi:hypothetical protein
VARLNGSRPSPAKRGLGKRRTSTGEARRMRCAHGKEKRGSGGEESAKQSSPVSSARAPASDSRGEDAWSNSRERERRSLEQDGEAGGELRWPKRATPASARASGGGCNRTDQLYEIK